jgi:hypothetical protein
MSLNCGIINRKQSISRMDYVNFVGPDIVFISHEQIANMNNIYDLITFQEMYHQFVSIKSQELDFTDDIEYNKLLDIIDLRDAISNKIIKHNILLKKKQQLDKFSRNLEIKTEISEKNRSSLSKNTSFSSMRSITPSNVYLIFD